MFGIGWTELLIVGVVALIFLGEDKFPEFVKVALRAFKDFRGYWDEIKGQVENEVRRPLERELKPLQRELNKMARNEPTPPKKTEAPSVTPPANAPIAATTNTSPDMGTPHESAAPLQAGTPYEAEATESEWKPSPAPEMDEPTGSINADDAKVMQSGAMPYASGGPGARVTPDPVPQESPAPVATPPATEAAPQHDVASADFDEDPSAPTRID